jgi:hypothetical protein
MPEKVTSSLLGEVSKSSLKNLSRLVDLFLQDTENAGLSQVAINVALESSGKLAIPLISEAGLSDQGSITLTFQRFARVS